MTKFEMFKVGVDVVAGIGVDAMITTAANLCIPKTYGIFGLAQRFCIKTGSIGLGLVAGRAIAEAIDGYVEDIKTAADEVLKEA